MYSGTEFNWKTAIAAMLAYTTKDSATNDFVGEIQLKGTKWGVIFEGSIQLNLNIRVTERCQVEHLSRVQRNRIVQDLSMECHSSGRHYFSPRRVMTY